MNHAADYHDYEEEIDRAHREKRARKPVAKKDTGDLILGIVVRARGHHYDVQAADEEGSARHGVYLCEVRGRLLQEKNIDTLVAVGDRVWLRPFTATKGQIERIEPRTRVLSRQHPGVDTPAEDVILANPDQVLVVFALTQPDPHLRMLDRFLVVAEANELPAIICVNKVDLAPLELAQELFELYAHIGYRVLYTSVAADRGIDDLRALLADRITVVAGPSGVGKSSLINAVDPSLQIKIGDLRDFGAKGKHTTRAAQLHPLPFGHNSFVADTPGIRELGLYDIDPSNLPFYFRELAPYLHQCRFPGCTHDHEPECAVREAVAAGAISAARYESYLRLLKGEE